MCVLISSVSLGLPPCLCACLSPVLACANADTESGVSLADSISGYSLARICRVFGQIYTDMCVNARFQADGHGFRRVRGSGRDACVWGGVLTGSDVFHEI